MSGVTKNSVDLNEEGMVCVPKDAIFIYNSTKTNEHAHGPHHKSG
jgi:hypothetical protein